MRVRAALPDAPSIVERPCITARRRAAAAAHARACSATGLLQRASTLVPLAIAWTLVGVVDAGPWAAILATPVIALLMLRVFVLMHDCGHRSLFASTSLDEAVGFVLGVITVDA